MNGARVVVVDPNDGFRRQIVEILRQAGYLVVAEAGDRREILPCVFQIQPDVVIMDAGWPGQKNFLVAKVIEEHRVAPVVFTMPYNQRGIIETARARGVYGVIIKPVSEEVVVPVLETAMACFHRLLEMEEENKKLRRDLETRKLVERAKGLLMEKKGLSEREAFRYIQKLSMDRCVPIAKIARQLIMLLEK